MTTKKKTDGRIKSTVKRAKENLEGTNPSVTVSTGYWKPTPIADDENEAKKGEMEITDTPEPQTYEFYWNDSKADEKRELAKDILIRLIDFNLEQLSRKDVDKVLIYDNPAEYAAEVVNELYEKVDDGK